MRFETEKDLERENKAIEAFLKPFKGTCRKLGDNDIDFEVYNSDGIKLAFVEVKGRLKNIENAFPLPVSVKKLIKLYDKKLNPLIIWACFDGIIYGKLRDLKGSIISGGRPPRKGSFNDNELMAYYNDSVNLKKIKYE